MGNINGTICTTRVGENYFSWTLKTRFPLTQTLCTNVMDARWMWFEFMGSNYRDLYLSSSWEMRFTYTLSEELDGWLVAVRSTNVKTNVSFEEGLKETQ